MLSLRAGRQPQRRAGAPGRSVRRASENATKVPLSKKCKLDIKRKHLRAAIPGCLAVNSYAVNLQLQIDGENLPDLYKCTIKKHVNNKTSCVSYRLQGTGIYNHLRGLYMRGFCCGEEPGVVVLVASREAAPDLSYNGLSDGEDVDFAVEARAPETGEADSEAERRQQRQRRQQRSRQQRKRRRENSDEEDEVETQQRRRSGSVAVKEEPADAALAGPSGRYPRYCNAPGQGAGLLHAHDMGLAHAQDVEIAHAHGMGLAHANAHDTALALHQFHRLEQHLYVQRLRSHPVAAEGPSPNGDGEVQVGLHAHALSGLADGSAAALICHENPHDDAVSTLNVPGVDDELVVVVAEAERRAAQDGTGPGPGSTLDPFDQLGLGVSLGASLGGVSHLGDGSGSPLCGGAQGHACLMGPGLLGQGVGVCSGAAPEQLNDGAGGVDAVDTDVGGLHNAGTSLQGGFPSHRDPLDLPLSFSPFSPRLLQELTGRPHLPRVGGHQPPPQMTNGWGALAPLDFDTNFNPWSRQNSSWPDPLNLALL